MLPQHSLPDQLHERIGQWLGRLGCADEVGLHSVTDGQWRRHPERAAILVGTHDLLLSRALMCGFGDATVMAPVSYALLHTDTRWVFDEMDLLGPALPVTVELQRLRDEVGTPSPTSTMWMSSDASLPTVLRITRLNVDPRALHRRARRRGHDSVQCAAPHLRIRESGVAAGLLRHGAQVARPAARLDRTLT